MGFVRHFAAWLRYHAEPRGYCATGRLAVLTIFEGRR